MKVILLSVLFCSVVYSKEAPFIQFPAFNAEHYLRIGEKFISEIQCIKRLDSVLKARWNEELKRIPTTDLGDLPKNSWKDKESNFARYNSFEDEWLMEEGSPAKKINQCIRHVLSDSSIALNELPNPNYLNCLTELIATNTLQEFDHQRNFDNLVNSSSTEQLPFRKFISFPEIVQLMFQNRNPNTWTSLERLLYGHTDAYLRTDADNSHRNYFASQNCDWINAKALREASTEAARLKEFTSQVRHSVNRQLAGRLVKEWNFDKILPRKRFELWLKSRQEMTLQLEKEVEQLRKKNKEAQWLCEYAGELATIFTEVQSNILLTGEKSSVHLEVSDVASRARTIQEALEKLNDTRQVAMKRIADKQDEGTRCLSAIVHFVENHRRYELASSFIDEVLEYPVIYCENPIKNEGLVRFHLCNCIGSFCISHYLAAVFAEEYTLVKGSDGVYKIVRSGIMSKRKVMHCHTLCNTSKN